MGVIGIYHVTCHGVAWKAKTEAISKCESAAAPRHPISVTPGPDPESSRIIYTSATGFRVLVSLAPE